MYSLTIREEQVLSHFAMGLAAKEIGDRLRIATNTVNKTIANVKNKVGLQKATELTAFYICKILGSEYVEVRRKVLTAGLATMMLALVMTLTFLGNDDVQRRFRNRSGRRNDYGYVVEFYNKMAA